MDNKVLLCGPVVCASEESYIICVPVNKKVLMNVRVGDEVFYCHSNGIRISDTRVQKFTVPSKLLDREKKYTVTYEEIISRHSYTCDKKKAVSTEYKFKPVEKKSGINIYHLSDVHGLEKYAVKAGCYFKDNLDILILNGDISSSSDTVKDIMLTYKIAFAITKGEIPCIITRGNHDLRGKCAEKLTEYLPAVNGRSYFTAKLGSIWFLILDCGEDKEDSHIEYSGTAAYHIFRKEETKFIDGVIENSDSEYNKDGVNQKIVVAHIPFCYDDKSECKGENPFNIEKELYTEWCGKIRKNIKPELSVFGHLHVTKVFNSNGEIDNKGLGGNIVLGGKPVKVNGKGQNVIGTAFSVENDEITVRFTDKNQNILEETVLKRNK